MKKRAYSLYLALGIIIFITVTATMSINSVLRYYTFENKTFEDMKSSSQETILSIKDNIENLIAAYAVNEYEKLIYNEISRKNIFAIVIEDYNMGKILGEKSLVSGKMKYSKNEIVDFDPTNEQQIIDLENSFYKQTYQITTDEKKVLGTISIYISDKKMKEELQGIINSNIKNSIILSLVLMTFLFLAIRVIILRPISEIIQSINQIDDDGIPTKPLANHSLLEINNLARNINKMISSIKRSRRVLKKEQNRLEYLLELSPIAVRIAKDHGQNVIFANKAYSKLLKLDEASTINKNPRDYYKDKKFYDGIIETLNSNLKIYNKLIELEIEGKAIWALASYMNINFDGENAVIGWFYDVTNEKRSESELYEALELQTRIFDNSSYLIIRTDTEGKIKQINKEVENLLGYSAQELVDKETPEKFHLNSELDKKVLEMQTKYGIKLSNPFEVLVTKSNLNMTNESEWTYVTKEGKHIPVLLSISALKNKDNEIYGYLGISRDISHNKIIESQSKLASMGEMIGNIAHQWRQPLSVISTIASGIKIKSEFDMLKESELVNDMDSITEQTKYLSKTIDDFRNFIKDNDKKESFDLASIIEKTISILNSSLVNNNIQVITNIEQNEVIKGFENQLMQAFINIINNSKDAMKEKLSAEDDKLIFINTYIKSNHLILNIKDNAGGIKKEIIGKIFDPYFTTKHQSIGTGIGLSMSYQIITEYHNATIKASNVSYNHDGTKYTGANFEIAFKLEGV